LAPSQAPPPPFLPYIFSLFGSLPPPFSISTSLKVPPDFVYVASEVQAWDGDWREKEMEEGRRKLDGWMDGS
jgi:hypothetical protein